MSKLHLEIFDSARLSVFKTLSRVEDSGVLAGGTALALQIGHRKSYDFDVFLSKPIESGLLVKMNQVFSNRKIRPVVNTSNELSIILDEEIKVTFLYFPFSPLHERVKTDFIDLYSKEDLASNKISVIGRRGEWKDYVDLYFLIKKEGVDLEKTIAETELRFKGNFSEKLFWQQLVYWDDLGEFKIEFMNKPLSKEEIQKYLSDLTAKRVSR